MIRYTGNPYVDAGVAVLELRLHKPCAEFTENDLSSQAEWIKREYRKKIWKSYLTVHFMNCAWVQPKIRQEKEREYIEKVLESYKISRLNPPRACAFCGGLANTIVDRSHVPLLTGEKVMVAGSGGQPGLPTCGFCVFAIHFYPLATLKVGGRPLFWLVSEPEWMRRLTNRFRQDIEKVLAASSEQFANVDWPSTRLLHAARDVVDEIAKTPKARWPPLCDIIGVHATNIGAKPDYEELKIPSGLLEFWSEAGTFGPLYRQIESSSWKAREKKIRKSKTQSINAKKKADTPSDLIRRNDFFEALGKAFVSSDYRTEAKLVAVRFLLRRSGKYVAPNTTVLAELFLEKVAGMEKARLEAIRSIADALVQSRNVNWIVDRLMRSGKTLYDLLPTMRAIERKLSTEKKPLAWDQLLFALGLNDEDDPTSRDSPLVYELILIRIFEQLGLAQPDVLAGLDVPDEDKSID